MLSREEEAFSGDEWVIFAWLPWRVIYITTHGYARFEL